MIRRFSSAFLSCMYGLGLWLSAVLCDFLHAKWTARGRRSAR
ncbi:MAG: hypothetical protein ACI4NN_02320 [Pyramidobacter sp.]